MDWLGPEASAVSGIGPFSLLGFEIRTVTHKSHIQVVYSQATWERDGSSLGLAGRNSRNNISVIVTK